MARRNGVRVVILGDEALRRRLASVHHALPEGVDEIAQDVADLMAIFARKKVPLGPARNGHVRTTLRGTTRNGTPVVEGGDAAHPYYGWLDFGGHVGPNRSVYRKKIAEGRYIYPTLRERRSQIDDQMSHGLEELLQRHGIEVRG